MSTAIQYRRLTANRTDQPTYQSYNRLNFRHLPQIRRLSGQQQFEIEVVASVFPFRTNNYVVNRLIDWNRVPEDPIFRLTFPQRHMLTGTQYELMAEALKRGRSRRDIAALASRIRRQLNPDPGSQMAQNVPRLDGRRLSGLQHKYAETVLCFPSQGQTCYAYCSFCFRWPQFVNTDDMKFAMTEVELLIAYLREHSEVTDVLLTGGDPMLMKASVLARYVEPLLRANLSSLQTIRIGTKSLSFWPYKYLVGRDAYETLALFRRIVRSGKHLAVMAHFCHPRELATHAVRRAIERIRATGAEIRTQSPLVRHINDRAELWATMWQKQIQLGCVPYYMFVARNTGAHHYFRVSLRKAYETFKAAYERVSGLSRTIRGPCMSAGPGKIQIVGISEVAGKRVFVLTMLQARNAHLVLRPFFAEYDEEACWIDELRPAFADKFIFE
jgi:L-lysine 2,3-aminomutase